MQGYVLRCIDKTYIYLDMFIFSMHVMLHMYLNETNVHYIYIYIYLFIYLFIYISLHMCVYMFMMFGWMGAQLHCITSGRLVSIVRTNVPVLDCW